MPTYSNGRIPLDLLVVFARGWNKTDGNWFHALSPATYAKHLALVERAKRRTGRKLVISGGWSAYRPYEAQVLARQIHGNWAAVPGTSSHGGFWEGRQTLAMDYGNWKYVYGNGDGEDTYDKRAAFFADCRAVGLEPDLISPRRGYPDEPWHVVDLDPWGPVPAGLNVNPLDDPEEVPEESEEDDMPKNTGIATGPTATAKAWRYLIFNYGSGIGHEFSGSSSGEPIAGSVVNELAVAFDTPPWAKVSESHYNRIVASLNDVQRIEIVS